jgi:acyl-CoA hydrolase
VIDSEAEETDGSADHPTEIEETDETAADPPSELEESDDTAADHASQVMSESGSDGVLSAEVRVLQVGNGQITRSIYRQLDEATFERFEPLGRVKDDKRKPKEGVLQLVGRDTTTGALVATTRNRLIGRPQMGRRSSRTG